MFLVIPNHCELRAFTGHADSCRSTEPVRNHAQYFQDSQGWVWYVQMQWYNFIFSVQPMDHLPVQWDWPSGREILLKIWVRSQSGSIELYSKSKIIPKAIINPLEIFFFYISTNISNYLLVHNISNWHNTSPKDWATQKHSCVRQIRSQAQNVTKKNIRVLTKYEESFSH